MGTLASELGAQVDARSRQPRIYADANVSARLIAHMRGRLAWDVLAVVEHDDLRRASDIEHYRLARRFHRVIVSLDTDFLDARRFPAAESPGVIVLSAPDERGLVRLLDQAARTVIGRRGRSAAGRPLVGRTVHLHPNGEASGRVAAGGRRRRARRV